MSENKHPQLMFAQNTRVFLEKRFYKPFWFVVFLFAMQEVSDRVLSFNVFETFREK